MAPHAVAVAESRRVAVVEQSGESTGCGGQLRAPPLRLIIPHRSSTNEANPAARNGSLSPPAPSRWLASVFPTRRHNLPIGRGPRRHRHCDRTVCPRQVQHPEHMFKACQDLLFPVQLVAAGFAEATSCCTLAIPSSARAAAVRESTLFREGTPIRGTIQKPIGRSPPDGRSGGVRTRPVVRSDRVPLDPTA